MAAPEVAGLIPEDEQSVQPEPRAARLLKSMLVAAARLTVSFVAEPK